MTHALARGGNVGLAQVGLTGSVVVTLTWHTTDGVDADLSAFLCAASGKIRSDEDFIFYNQPVGGNGAITHVGKSQRGITTVDQIALDVSALPADIEKIVIGASLDGVAGFGGLSGLGVEVAAGAQDAPTIRAELDATNETGMVFAEVYLRNGEWKVRAVGQGYTNGLTGLATDFGVSVDDEPVAPAPAPAISLEKTRMVNLEKALSTDTAMLSLVKKAGINLEKKGLGEHTARVALVLDISGSMSRLYSSGAVQRLAERVLALGLRFDDDGEVDLFLFGARVHHVEGGLSLDGYQQRIAEVLKSYPLEYNTKYGAAMAAVRKHYMGTSGERVEPQPAPTPVYVMFVTDGAPSDKGVATKQIRAASYEPIFWQFMGIGPAKRFTYLQRLDDLDNRFTDNADFFSLTEDDLMGRKPVDDEVLFAKMTEEYPAYLPTARRLGLLSD